MLGGMILHWLYVAYTFCCGADFAAFAGASGMNLHAFASPKKAQSVREKNRSLSKKEKNCNNVYLYRLVEAMLEKLKT